MNNKNDYEKNFVDFVKSKIIIDKTVNMEVYKSLENYLLYIMFVETKKIDYEKIKIKETKQKLIII